MGLDRDIYLQACIKIPTQYEDYTTLKRVCCGKNRNDDMFCSKCGKEVKDQPVTEKNRLWIEDFMGGNDNFWDYTEGETMYLFSNIEDCGIDTEVNVFSMISEDIIKDKIRLFETVHSEDIRLLEKKINTKVKVEFGFVYRIW